MKEIKFYKVNDDYRLYVQFCSLSSFFGGNHYGVYYWYSLSRIAGIKLIVILNVMNDSTKKNKFAYLVSLILNMEKERKKHTKYYHTFI